MGTELIAGKWLTVCATCEAVSPHKWVKSSNGTEACSNCAGFMPDTRPRDAMGNIVKVSNDVMGKYSYAIDGPITSQRQYASILRERGLAQK